ncbi:hypothetical protein [Bacillus sp. OTU530]|uniref:hypothetical protein n=1 Tax=Bacillus sp. OTU530 TaxID=3043862 RepID=UPI00313BDBEC
MDFFLVAILYWVLIGASLFLLFWGVWKKSWKALLASGIALLLPALSLYFGSAEGWFRLAALPPVIIVILAYYTKITSGTE